MKKLFPKLAIVAAAIALVSCDSEDIPTSVYSDAFIISKKIDGVERYGLALHAYSNNTLQAASAQAEDGTQYTLNAVNSFNMEYYYEDSEENYTEDAPEAGLYQFSVTPTSGETIVDGNQLNGRTVDTIDFTTCEYDAERSRISLAWEQEQTTSYSVVRLLNAQGEVVYFSNALAATARSAYITSNNWVAGVVPGVGETYTVELHVFLRESGSNQQLDAKTITVQDVVWGE